MISIRFAIISEVIQQAIKTQEEEKVFPDDGEWLEEETTTKLAVLKL